MIEKPFKPSSYLYPWVKDSYFRMFIRWAYAKYLDELYIPQGTEVSKTFLAGGRTGIKIGSPNYLNYKRRKGVQEFYWTDV